MTKVWKKYPHNNYYLVSSTGEIKGIHNTKKNGYLRPGVKDKDGYLRFQLKQKGEIKLVAIHRMVAETFLPKIKGKNQVNHKNGKKDDNRVLNLEWCSLTENRRHAFRTGLQKPIKGEKHKLSKLSNAQVKQIRLTYRLGGITQTELAKQYAVVPQHIAKIVHNQTRV